MGRTCGSVPRDKAKNTGFLAQPFQFLPWRLHFNRHRIGRIRFRPFATSHTMVSTFAIQNLTDSTLVRGFVTADCGRGTIDILWSCLTAIFLSIWTVIHLPVPCFDIERPDNFRRKVVRSKIVPSLIALLAPELMLFIALVEITEAYAMKEYMENLSMDSTLTSCFFLRMGGFCLRAPTGRCHQLRTEDIEYAINASKTAAEIKDTSTASNTAVESKDALSHSTEWVQELKRIKENDIEDLAKSDSVTKFIACLQGLWVLTQAISRIHQHKALSLLEVTTSAYICCAVGIYAFWWKKPQDCSVPIMITCSDEAIDELSSSAYAGRVDQRDEFLWAGRAWVESNKTISGYSTFTHYCRNGLYVLSLMIFGSVHLASWNSRLPSTIELWMWRGSSLYCVIYAGFFVFFSVVRSDERRPYYHKLLRIVALGFLFYVIVRTYMIVEVFISLRALPASAFQTVKWSSFVLHI